MDLLVIKSLTIKDFEDISFFEASFDPDYVMLDMPEAETVAKAVSVILKSVRMQNFSDELHITTGTFMSAEVDINGETFFVTAKGCPEKKGFRKRRTSRRKLLPMKTARLLLRAGKGRVRKA